MIFIQEILMIFLVDIQLFFYIVGGMRAYNKKKKKEKQKVKVEKFGVTLTHFHP